MKSGEVLENAGENAGQDGGWWRWNGEGSSKDLQRVEMEVECAERSVDRRQFCVVQTVHNVHTKGSGNREGNWN